MAALRRIIGLKSSSSLTLSTRLICHRGIATKLFVAGLPFYTSEKTFSEAFSKYGQVVEAKLVTDKVSNKSKGFGFVTFASEDEADNALNDMNGSHFNGRVIYVDYAKPTQTFDGGMPVARGPPEPRH